MQDKIQDILQAAGIRDFDELTSIERDSYFKMLEIAESGKITLDDYQKHVKRMRESVEFSLAVDHLGRNQDLFLKARLKTYILLEAFFEKPDRAREMLEQYKKVASMKVK